MIIDTLNNADKYIALHPRFGRAFEYLHTQDPEQMEDGKQDIDGENLRAIASNKNGMTAAESTAKFECHNQHIDIQVCIRGVETIGWKPRGTCTQQKGDYNSEKDVLFYADEPDMYFQLHAGQFAIFYPEDVHAPMIGEGPIKKLVVKIRL